MKSKLVLEDRVTPAGVIGFCIWLMGFMWTTGIVEWVWLSPTLALFLMIPLGGLLLIFGIEKPSVFKFALDGIKILADESLTIQQRMIMARELLEKIVGLNVLFSDIENEIIKEKAKKIEEEKLDYDESG